MSSVELKQAQDSAYSIWFDHKHLKQRYSKLSPITLFNTCLKEHGLQFTFKKALIYIKNHRYINYFTNHKKEKITMYV